MPESDQGMWPVGFDRPTNGGTDGSTGPCILARTAPMLGLPPMVFSESCAQPDMH